jgi:hypothetical protein
MGSLLDQLKGGLSRPGKATKAGGSKAKRAPKPRTLARHKSGKTPKSPPRIVQRRRGSKVLTRGRG